MTWQEQGWWTDMMDAARGIALEGREPVPMAFFWKEGGEENGDDQLICAALAIDKELWEEAIAQMMAQQNSDEVGILSVGWMGSPAPKDEPIRQPSQDPKRQAVCIFIRKIRATGESHGWVLHYDFVGKEGEEKVTWVADEWVQPEVEDDKFGWKSRFFGDDLPNYDELRRQVGEGGDAIGGEEN